MAFIISSILLIAFGILAVIDGFYLHIFKYQLFNQEESKFEHFTHTVRAMLFPLIVYFLFVKQNCITSFYLGIGLVILDIIVLTMDAFVEVDSRKFMGGLPRWEYILHLLVNGFHFASIAVFLVIKLHLTPQGLEIVPDLSTLPNYNIFHFVSTNLIPGAIIIALVHIATSFSPTKAFWNQYRAKITCC